MDREDYTSRSTFIFMNTRDYYDIKSQLSGFGRVNYCIWEICFHFTFYMQELLADFLVRLKRVKNLCMAMDFWVFGEIVDR